MNQEFLGLFRAVDGLIVVFIGQSGFVTAKAKDGKKLICVWSSEEKAKQAARSQGVPLSKLRPTPMTVERLKGLSKKYGIRDFVLDPAFDGAEATNTCFSIRNLESIQ